MVLRGSCGLIDDASAIMQQVFSWIDENLTIQIDPLASIIAVVALVVAIRANLRATRLVEADRHRAGNISRVAIHEHSFQAAMDGRSGDSHRNSHTTPQRDTGDAEGFVCSVYSGDTDVEVESVYLKIIFTRGVIGQERWEIRVDIQSSEGLAAPATNLPFRMQRNSRLDWTFPTFVTWFPNARGRERRLDVTRVMGPNEQLRFEFGAYSRVSAAPVIAEREHRLGLFGFPTRGGPWTRVVKHSSLWDALISPECPESLKGWFLEWLECRADFQDRVDADATGKLRDCFHDVLLWNYWPPGMINVGVAKAKFGDPENDTPRHRVQRTLLALPSMAPMDSGPTVSGPGASGELSQFRIGLAMSVLAGIALVPNPTSRTSDWPSGLADDDPVLRAAAEARRLSNIRKQRPLSGREGEALREQLSTLSRELSRCTYGPPSDCEVAVSEVFKGNVEFATP